MKNTGCYELDKKETLEKLWRAYPERNSPGYGYGFGVDQTPVGRVVGHNGDFAGINANFNMCFDSSYTIAILSNYGDGLGPIDSKAHELMDVVE